MAYAVTFVALVDGLWIGCVLAAILAVTFGKRLSATGKFMPSGMLLIASLAAAVILGYSAWTAVS